MESKKNSISASCMCEEKNGIWFVHDKLPILFFFNFYDEKITKYKIIPNVSDIRENLFSTVIKCDNKLVLVSENNDKSLVYDIKKDNFSELMIKASLAQAFFGATKKDNNLYLIPFKYDNVVRIGMKDLSVEYIANWRKLYNNSNLYINNTNCIMNNGNVLVTVPTTNTCLLFNVELEMWEKIEIKGENVDCTAITYNDRKIYIYDRKNNEIKRLDMKGNVEKISKKLEIEGVTLHMIENRIIVDSVYTNDILVFDRDLQDEKRYTKNILKTEINLGIKSFCWYENNGKYYIITRANELLVVDKYMNIKEYELQMDDRLKERLMEDYYFEYNNKALHEDELMGLYSLIKWIKNDNIKRG